MKIIERKYTHSAREWIQLEIPCSINSKYWQNSPSMLSKQTKGVIDQIDAMQSDEPIADLIELSGVNASGPGATSSITHYIIGTQLEHLQLIRNLGSNLFNVLNGIQQTNELQFGMIGWYLNPTTLELSQGRLELMNSGVISYTNRAITLEDSLVLIDNNADIIDLTDRSQFHTTKLNAILAKTKYSKLTLDEYEMLITSKD